MSFKRKHNLILQKNRLKNWLRDHAPTWCIQCRWLHFNKYFKYERYAPTGRYEPLCPKCHTELYQPFSKEDQ